MGKLETADILLGILYATGAILLFVTSYILFIKRFKRNKLEAVSEVVFSTSRYDSYGSKTQFLIELSDNMNVELNLLDVKENQLKNLLNKELDKGENTVDFDPTDLENGIYYLSLKTKNASILRKINVARS